MHLRFSILDDDDSDSLQIECHAATPYCSSTIDFYTRLTDLKDFGHALRNFTGAPSDRPVFEAGSPEEPWYSWLRLRAFAYDSLGHSVLEVSTNRNGAPQIQQSSRFCGLLEVAAINRLGYKIASWDVSESGELLFDSADC